MKKSFWICLAIIVSSTWARAGTVTVSSPLNNTTVATSVKYVAIATTSCSKGVAAMGIYTAPYQLAYKVNGASLSTTLNLNPGSYSTVVQEWDNCGGYAKTPIDITVTGDLVTVASPTNNSTVGTTVQYSATGKTSCASGMKAMGVYTSTSQLAWVPGGSLNTKITFAPGTYSTVVKGWDNCGGSGKTPVNISVSSTTTTMPTTSHVFLLVEENHSYSQVIGNTAMPYLNSLASKYGLATKYYANTHPSIGNYFMLTTGQIITNNDSFCSTITQDNIVRHLLSAGKTWKSYAESLPSVGYTGCSSGSYVKRHNPFAYFSDVANSSSERLNLVPFSQFAVDLNNNAVPNFSFIVPNLADDAHDGTLSEADTWLKDNLAKLFSNAAFQNGGILIIVFDESVSSDTQEGGGHVAAVVIGPKVKLGYKSTTNYQHQNTLKTLMEALGLTSFPGNASSAADMKEFF